MSWALARIPVSSCGLTVFLFHFRGLHIHHVLFHRRKLVHIQFRLSLLSRRERQPPIFIQGRQNKLRRPYHHYVPVFINLCPLYLFRTLSNDAYRLASGIQKSSKHQRKMTPLEYAAAAIRHRCRKARYCKWLCCASAKRNRKELVSHYRVPVTRFSWCCPLHQVSPVKASLLKASPVSSAEQIHPIAAILSETIWRLNWTAGRAV